MKKQIEKPYNGGKWTEARMRSFAMSAIRRAQWPAKYEAIDKAFIGNGINPKTGKPCKLHKCPICEEVHPKGNMHADHINTVIPLGGFSDSATTWLGYDWNIVMQRLWCEGNGFVAICKPCHGLKCETERKQRAERKRIKTFRNIQNMQLKYSRCS